MMTAAPMIRSSVVNLVVGAVRSRPGGRELLHSKYGIGGALADLYHQTSLSQYLSLFEDAAALAGDEFLGARLGNSLPAGELLGPIGFLVLAAPSIKDGLGEIARYIGAWQDATEILLRDQEDVLVWSYRITDSRLWPRRQDAEFTIAATCTMVRACFGSSWAPREIHFEHPRPPGWQALKAILRTRVLFDQPNNALILNLSDAERLVQAQSPGFAPFLRRHIEEMLETPGGTGIGDQVRGLVARDLGHRAVNLQTLATQLGMPPRTLQRYLAAERSSVRDIVRDVRIQQAKSLLETGRCNMGTVSRALGYSDSTAFWRAFKSREEVAPGVFRQQAQKGR